MRRSAASLSSFTRSGVWPHSASPCRHLSAVCWAYSLQRDPFEPGVFGIDPFLEVLGFEVLELQQQVDEVPLEVDDDARNAVDGRFFEQVDAQAGLAGAGHADDDAVRRQIAGLVHDGLVEGLFLGQVIFPAQIEAGGLFDVFANVGQFVGNVGHGNGSSW